MTTTPRPAHLRALLPAAPLLALGLVLSACGGGAPSTDATDASPVAAVGSASSTRTATLTPGDPVPAPTGKVILVVRGGTTTNVGGELRLDRALLESMGTTELTVDDDLATGRTATFSGPLVRTVLAIAGAGPATTMHTIALNDYVADVPVADAADLPLIVATRMDGRPMSVANYGPTRFVYPTDAGLDPATYEPRWVWQLATVELR